MLHNREAPVQMGRPPKGILPASVPLTLPAVASYVVSYTQGEAATQAKKPKGS